MKKILTVLITMFVMSTAYAGGSVGGGGGSIIITGNTMIEAGEIQTLAEGRLALEKSRLMDVVASSMDSSKPMLFNGEKLSADRFDFKTGRFLLRSLDDPTRMITLEAISPE